MAKFEWFVVGRRVKCLGRAGEIIIVDVPRSLVTVRLDNAKPGEVESVVGMGEVELIEPSDAEQAAAKKAKAIEKEAAKPKVPTHGQITAARHKAEMAGKAEGLKGSKLEDVQDEAEAELVVRVGRGEQA